MAARAAGARCRGACQMALGYVADEETDRAISTNRIDVSAAG
jgi:hypothetical protein